MTINDCCSNLLWVYLFGLGPIDIVDIPLAMPTAVVAASITVLGGGGRLIALFSFTGTLAKLDNKFRIITYSNN